MWHGLLLTLAHGDNMLWCFALQLRLRMSAPIVTFQLATAFIASWSFGCPLRTLVPRYVISYVAYLGMNTYLEISSRKHFIPTQTNSKAK